MADKLIFEVVAEGKNLKVVQKDSDKLADSIERSDTARKKSGKGQDAYNKREKALYQTNLSSAKGFSKMKGAMGGGSSGLVGAYATLAANVFAATAAFNALRNAAQVDQLISGLEHVGAVSGRNLGAMADKLKDITGNAISTEEAMRGVALGISSGFSSSQMEQLTKVARGASLALGRDMGDAMSRLTRGAAKLEPEILDELGIMVRLDDATEKYAATLGKSVTSLTQYERRMAFINAINEEGLEKFGAIADAIDPVAFDQLSAAMADLAQNGMSMINNFLGPFIKLLSGNLTTLTGGMVLMGSTITRQMLPGLYRSAEASREAAKATADNATMQLKAISTTGKYPKVYKEYVGAVKSGNYSLKEYDSTMQSLTKSEQTYQQHIKYTNEHMGETVNGIRITNGKLQEQEQSLMGVQGAMRNLQDGHDSNVKSMVAQHRANAMQSASQGNLITGFREMRTANALNREESKKSSKGLGTFAKFTKSAGVSARNFGAGLRFVGTSFMAMLPFIGIAIALFGVLKQAWEEWFPTSAVEKAKETALDTLSSIQEAQEQLNITLEMTEDTLERTAAKYTAYAGVLSTVADAIMSVADAADAENKKTRMDNAKTIGQLQKWKRELETMQEEAAASGKKMAVGVGQWQWRFWEDEAKSFVESGAMANKKIEDYTDRIAELKDANDDLRSQKGKIQDDDRGAIEEVMKSSISELGLSEVFSDMSGGHIKAYEDLLKDLKSVETYEELRAKVAEVGAAHVQFGEDLKAAGAASSAYSKSANKLASKRTTRFDETIDQLDTMGQSYGQIEKVSAAAVKMGQFDTQEAAMEHFNALMSKRLNIQQRLGIENEADFTKFKKRMKAERDGLLTAQAMQKKLAAQVKRVAAAAKEIPEALKYQLDLQEKIKDSKEAEILHQIELNRGLLNDENDGLKAREANIKLHAELAALTASRIPKIERELQVNIKTEQVLLKRLKVEQEIYNLNKESADLRARQLRAEMELANQRSGDPRLKEGLTAGQELVAAKLETSEAIRRVNIERDMKIKIAEIEKNIVVMQTKLLHMQIRHAINQERAAFAKGKQLVEEKSNLTLLQQQAKDKTQEVNTTRGSIRSGKQGELSEINQQIAAVEGSITRLNAQGAIVATSAMTAAVDAMETSTDEGMVELLGEDGKGGSINEKFAALKAKLEQEAITLNAELRVKEGQLTAAFGKAMLDAATAGSGSMADVIANVQAAMYVGTKDELEKRQEELRVTAEAIAKAANKSEADIKAAGDKAAASITPEGMWDEASLTQKVGIMNAVANPLIEKLKALGPEGEYLAGVAQGAFTIADSWSKAFDNIDKDSSGMEKAQHIAGALAGTIGAIADIQAAASKKRVAAIDSEIAMEKKRDGKSKESLAKIAKLEKKKVAEQRKAFERNKKMRTGEVIMDTASAIMKAAQTEPWMPMGLAMAVVAGAMGMMQLSAIQSATFSGGGKTPSAPAGPAQVSIGKRTSAVDTAKGRGNVAGELAYLRGERGVGSGASDFIPGGFTGRKYRATGGFVVGEQGPELFVPQVPGQVLSQSDATGMGAPISVNFNINAIDTANMEDMLERRRGSIINMIRGAANEHGQDFLEMVDTDTYNDDSGSDDSKNMAQTSYSGR